VLMPALGAMGVPLFQGAPLNDGLFYEFSALPILVGDVAQRAMIEVDEYGVVAAAVTVIGIQVASSPPPPIPMHCNRPFAFVLYDTTTDGGKQVLFTGVVQQP